MIQGTGEDERRSSGVWSPSSLWSPSGLPLSPGLMVRISCTIPTPPARGAQLTAARESRSALSVSVRIATNHVCDRVPTRLSAVAKCMKSVCCCTGMVQISRSGGHESERHGRLSAAIPMLVETACTISKFLSRQTKQGMHNKLFTIYAGCRFSKEAERPLSCIL